jgi:hypothetical protein
LRVDAVSAPTATAAARCPRCGGTFHCGAAGLGPCPCAGIDLGATLQLRLRQQFSGCLCLACLQALARAEPAPECVAPVPEPGS